MSLDAAGASPPINALPDHIAARTVVGELLLPANDQVVTSSIAQTGTWEPSESAALIALIRPGARVLDVGAHVGYLTLLAAARTGATGGVLAVEANRANFQLLQANIARNGAAHVRAVHAAAWRQSGETLTMSVSADNSGDHRVFRRDQATETVDVPALAMDDIVPEDWHVDVVKIDVQGTDHVAVEGMRRTIERCRPMLLVEFWPAGIEEFGDSPAEVLAQYRGLNYEISVLEEPAVSRTTPLETIVDLARGTPGAFCTLLLAPLQAAERRPVGEAAASLIARGPVPGRRSALRRLGPLARTVVLRALRPYTVHQQAVDSELAGDLQELSRRIDALERRGSAGAARD
jgi:FkbM family methyltransferase